jgi:hypothetical protein
MFGLFFMPIYKWVVDTSACMYCDLAQFGYAGGVYQGTIAPYGIFWYIFYFMISRFGYLIFVILLWVFDTAIFALVLNFQSPIYIYFFTISSMFFFFVNPADLLIFWLAVLGKEAPIMSILATISKLPWPAPLWVWQFVYNISLPSSTTYIFGWPRYLLLGLWIIHPSFYYLRSKLK